MSNHPDLRYQRLDEKEESLASKLEKVPRLYETGGLTDHEYSLAKRKLLGADRQKIYKGPKCPQCNSANIKRKENSHQYICEACEYSSTDTIEWYPNRQRVKRACCPNCGSHYVRAEEYVYVCEECEFATPFKNEWIRPWWLTRLLHNIRRLLVS